MYTFQSVLESLGKNAQVTGGCILVRDGMSNLEIGRNDPGTGTFVLSARGAAYLEALVTPVEEEPAPKPKAKAKAKAEASVDDLDLD